MTDELERRLGEHLAATARPMPRAVADGVLRGVESRSQVPRRWEAWMRAGRLSLVAGGAAAVVLAAAFGPALLGRIGAVLGPGGVAATLRPSPAYVWDAILNFRGSPIQANPSMDGYGNQAVWSYLEGPSRSSDPGGYARLTAFEASPRGSWIDTGSTLAIGQPEGVDRLTLRPAPGQTAILAWRSPYDVSVTVAGSVEVDGACGDGIAFWIDRGADRLETLSVPSGTRPIDRALTVDVGEILYFGVDAGSAEDADCDTTWLRLTISGG